MLFGPDSLLEKDLNDMVNTGHDVQNLVESNTYSGLSATLYTKQLEASMSNGFTVKKRDGSVEKINLDKVHIMVEHACRGLAGVSESQVEMNANLQFFDGIETKDIQEILVRSANDLISLEAPNYQFVAARLLLFGLRKSVYGEHPDQRPDLYDHLLQGTKKGIYDPLLQSFYTEEEWGKINAWIDHDRDYIFTYAGLRQVVDKYLVQDQHWRSL